MIMGVVADDITGSNDIGIMFTNGGCLAHIYTYEKPGDFRNLSGRHTSADVVILDTNSRLDTRDEAYRKVYAATKELQEAGCQRFHKKTCSVFRGNIGAEFDAMLDALGEEFAVVVLGFPKNGRKTLDGIHYVHGRLLEESEFRSDPIHPMTSSSLADILGSQTKRKVGLITHGTIEQGPDAVKMKLDELRGQVNYIIMDVVDQVSLRTIAFGAAEEKVICGSSAIAEELPGAWGFEKSEGVRVSLPEANQNGVLVLAGSLMPQTAAQIEHLKSIGIEAVKLDPGYLFDPDLRKLEVQNQADVISKVLKTGRDILYHTPNHQEEVEDARRMGAKLGYSPTQTGRLVSETIAMVSDAVRERTGFDRLVVAGGETSAAVCARLGIDGLAVWEEIQPGLPSCVSLSKPPMFLVLKSGSFGQPDFLEKAIQHLKEQVEPA